MKNKIQNCVIGVDGGGTKTVAVLANTNGKILKTALSGPSSPRNIGIEMSVENVAKAIKPILNNQRTKIVSTFIGLPCIAEEFYSKRGKIKKELQKRVPKIFSGKVEIGSDQEVAFRSGSLQKDGVLIISGTGCVSRGWKGKEQAHSSGCGWLADEGSAFSIGQKVFQEIIKDLDGRGPKTLMTKITLKELKLKTGEDLAGFVYSKNPTTVVPLLSAFCDKASEKGDLVAKKIMIWAGQELSLNTVPVIKKLKFKSSKFPLVLVGGVFKSKILLRKVKKEIKKIAPRAEIILPKVKPVVGAVRIAIEAI